MAEALSQVTDRSCLGANRRAENRNLTGARRRGGHSRLLCKKICHRKYLVNYQVGHQIKFTT